MQPRLSSFAALLLLCLAACTSPPSQPTGSVQFATSTQQALSASDITRVKVTVSAADMSSLVVELAKSNGSWGGLIGNIPAGTDRSFLAEAFDSSHTQRFQGQTSGVTLSAHQTTAVAITLQEMALPPPYANEAPVIDSLVASSTSVQTGSSLSLTTTVHDPNAGDTLSLAWTASGGTFSDPTAATTSWTAPSSIGVQTLTFTVTDSQGAAASVSLVVNVVSGTSTGNAAVNISFNLVPVVSKVSASLNRLDVEQSTAVSANASDADGDTLSYQWAATCPGTWTHATSRSASFVPSSVPASVCNNCQLTVTVRDGRGGQNTGSLSLCITSASTHRFPPLVTNFYQSATAASPNQTISFDVTAMDPQSSSLTFAWSANTGSLATAQNTATISHIVWTAPACTQAGITPTVTATVTNAFGLSASQAFSLSSLNACVASWATAGTLVPGRQGHTSTLLPSGKVLITGGYNGGYLASAALYDPATGTWSATGSMAAARSGPTATLLNNGKVLIAGGYPGGAATAELYDPTTGTWSATGSMPSGRGSHTATLLPNGKVLVAGGWTTGPLTTAALYDPASGTWNATGSLASARDLHTATLLPNGKVLVAGGSTNVNATATLATAEVYDPASGTWSTTASLATARNHHTATLLPHGKVLVAGGSTGSSSLASAEVYDPAMGTWSAAASMASPRSGPTATLLNHGTVLISGGYNGGYPAAAEMYDPGSGTWSATASMASPRYFHTATLLSTGKVLVSGGTSASGHLTSAEVYTP
ncbi:kelch repeat-containing protein [Stigmatella sp. ncwal1]|uniref:Kelch repeat-containing protein n=1 Tax=Stigmatella ashevillensis TaxID=2995309 RepID=A0ABT5DK48_9BACT|nr:kelch repeat-containing protein [Stigmatella ashevillena]MDC0712741.1 kelch repeat-containing protein [Stigmatella ashevillena]